MERERRLLRLVRAQLDIAKVLEKRLAAEKLQLNILEETRTGTMAALERVSAAGLAFYAVTMRRLNELDNNIAATQSRTHDLSAQLLRARNRQEILSGRAGQLESVRLRRGLEDETREIALGMKGKAAGKPHLLK